MIIGDSLMGEAWCGGVLLDELSSGRGRAEGMLQWKELEYSCPTQMRDSPRTKVRLRIHFSMRCGSSRANDDDSEYAGDCR